MINNVIVTVNIYKGEELEKFLVQPGTSSKKQKQKKLNFQRVHVTTECDTSRSLNWVSNNNTVEKLPTPLRHFPFL